MTIKADPDAGASSTHLQRSASVSSTSTNNRAKRPVAEHGNYQGYYKKRRTCETDPDPRLALIPAEWFQGSKVLDVGCNSGQVTIEVAQLLGAVKVVGVDIDKTLIEAARAQVSLAWSRQSPNAKVVNEAAMLDGAVMVRDRPPHEQEPPSPPAPAPPNPSYFPVAFARVYGYLPLPPRKFLMIPMEKAQEVSVKGKRKRVGPSEETIFPANLAFEVADWPVEGIRNDGDKYDLILAFSLTKWIHLHTFNAGLLTFFTRCFNSLSPGGRLILEAQPFSTYASSARPSPTLKSNLDKLRAGEGDEKVWKSEDGDFRKVLLETVGFERVEELGTGGEDGFKRPVEAYIKSL